MLHCMRMGTVWHWGNYTALYIYWYQVPSYLLPKIFLVDTSWIDKFDPIAVKYLCL